MKSSGRESRTHYHVQEKYADAAAKIECKLESGRTHQIRVHMAAIKHPLIGDPLYGPQATAVQAALKRLDADDVAVQEVLAFPRQALHAGEISFVHPTLEKDMHFEKKVPEDFSKLLKVLT